MRDRPLAVALVSLAALGALGCSSGSEDEGASNGGAPIPSAFAEFCGGALTTSVSLMRPESPAVWMSDGSSAPAGSEVLLTERFDKWRGYSFDASGSPLMTNEPLEKGTHFTSDCAPDSPPNFGGLVHVLLADSTFYPNEDLSGTPCVLPAGTKFQSFSFMASGTSASVSADEIQAQCQLAKSYSKDIVYGELLAK